MSTDGGDVPEGFALATSRGPFTRHNGPVYRAEADGDVRSGLIILARHCNSMGFLHGGMAAAFCDGALAWAVWCETERLSVTLKLTLTYFDVVEPGEWIEAVPRIDAVSSDIVHVHANVVTGGNRRVARADGVFRLLRKSRR